ncbi:protein JINGUBANG-like [Bidens hawaiensis]|uniref:protein JINGUBANG-like n=1 Tax=Bidens hawaiensis TaxID=980011 RepID=UPI00404933B3
MVGNINFQPFSCSFRLFSNPKDDHESSNLRSLSFSFSQDSFNSSFSSRSSLPPSLSTVITPSNTVNPDCLFTIKPNSCHILSLILTGNHLFSGSSSNLIHRWPRHPDATSDEEFISVRCNSAVKCLQMVNDDIIISGHQDNKIRVWKINKVGIDIVTSLPTLKDRLTKVLFAKNYVTIRRHKKLTWVHHNDAVSSLAVSVDKSRIYSASWDRSFKVWRSSDFKCLESVSNAHDDAINAIILSDEGFVYTSSADRKIKVWRFNQQDRKHNLINSLTHHKSAVNALAYDNNLSVLISGACSGVMIACERNFFDDGDGGHMMVFAALLGHRKAILCVKIVNELVCSGSADKTVRLWRRFAGKSYSCVGVLEGHGGPVKCLAVAAESDDDGDGDGDGEGRKYMVYSGSLDGDIKAWKVWVPLANVDG